MSDPDVESGEVEAKDDEQVEEGKERFEFDEPGSPGSVGEVDSSAE